MASIAANPWALGASYISVGGLRKILQFAETTKINDITLNDIPEEALNPTKEDDTRTFNCTPSSLKQINFLKEISRLDEELHKFQEEKERNIAFKSTADLTDSKALDAILFMVEGLCEHLQDLIDSRGILISRLREAYDDHITVHADLHKDVIECFPLIAKQLGQLNTALESIIWTNKFSIDDCNLNSACKNVASRLADVQSYYQSLDESRALMRTRVRRHHDDSDRTLIG